MTRLLAFDPGETTGWSLWFYDPVTPLQLLEHGQIGGGLRGVGLFAKRWLEESEWPDEIVTELFIDDKRTERPNVTPLRVEGALDARFGVEGIPIAGQRNTAKANAPDDLLKAHQLWFVGQPHATDSARHAIAFLKARQHRPTVRRFWPPRTRPGTPVSTFAPAA